jgi:ribonuclease D
MNPAQFVTDQASLEQCCREWRAAGCLAFDTEFIRDETYEAALCLLQVNSGGLVVLVDPVSGLDLDPFWELVTDPAVMKIVHAGKEDCELCLRFTGRPPRNVFDVQIAAGFVGYGYPLSLARLVLLALSRRIAKGQTLTDWLRRPLTGEQVRYAVEDVVYLPALAERIRRLLEQKGRSEWAREEFARFEEVSFYRPPAPERLARIRGAGRLDGQGLALLERLVEWRDEWARQKNRPVRAMMRDDVLVEIARRRPSRPEDLAVLRGFPQARNPRIIREILTIIEETRKLPTSELPVVREPREEPAMTRVVLEMLSAVMRAICHEQEISLDLLGGPGRTRELLGYLSGESADPPVLLSGWREQFIGRRLVELLEGRAEIHLSGWPRAPKLEVVAHRPQRRSRTHA